MDLVSKCNECGSPLKETEFKLSELPHDVPRDQLMRVDKCTGCGLIVFHIKQCEECNDSSAGWEYECTATGVSSTDTEH